MNEKMLLFHGLTPCAGGDCARSSSSTQVLRGTKTVTSLDKFSLVYLSLRGGAIFGWIWIWCRVTGRVGDVCGSKHMPTFCNAVTVGRRSVWSDRMLVSHC